MRVVSGPFSVRAAAESGKSGCIRLFSCPDLIDGTSAIEVFPDSPASLKTAASGPPAQLRSQERLHQERLHQEKLHQEGLHQEGLPCSGPAG